MLKKTTVVFLGLFAGLLLSELALRFIPYGVGEPLKSMIREAQRIPYSNLRTYNGLRGGFRILLPPKEKREILVVGDSFPFGVYEKVENTYPELLGHHLLKKVANLGVASTGPGTYTRMVEVGLEYQPQFIVYAIFTNDFFSGQKPLPDSELFYRELPVSEKAASVFKWITNWSLIYQFSKLLRQPSLTQEAKLVSTPGGAFMMHSQQYLDTELDLHQTEVKKGFDEVLEQTVKAKALADQAKAKFLVVLQPNKEMVYGQYQTNIYEELEKELAKQSIKALDLTPGLKLHQNEKLYNTIDGHFTTLGHQRAADLILKSK